MNTKKVAYLGPEGTFSHQAALSYFGVDSIFISVPRIKDIFSSIYTGAADFGVVPAENSSGGVIADTMDLFINTRLKVYDEIRISISQTLLSNTPKEDIKRIYSHPQSFAQTSGYLSRFFPKVELIETNSNIEAALLALKDSAGASIGPEITSEMYSISILEKEINDKKDNTTRFFVMSNNIREELLFKSVILFSVPNKFGALYYILKVFKDNKCNMTQIASRPAKTKNWDYVFIVEFENLKDKKKQNKMIEQLKRKTDFFDFLGTFDGL